VASDVDLIRLGVASCTTFCEIAWQSALDAMTAKRSSLQDGNTHVASSDPYRVEHSLHGQPDALQL
jgi:hypothetical protein